ncbi:MAG: hypothetical protein ABI443_11115 [Chthoniobacterales bacterium]
MPLSFRIIRILGVITGLVLIYFFARLTYNVIQFHHTTLLSHPQSPVQSILMALRMSSPELLLAILLILPFRRITNKYLWSAGLIVLVLIFSYFLFEMALFCWRELHDMSNFHATSCVISSLFLFIIFLQIVVIFLQRRIDAVQPSVTPS